MSEGGGIKPRRGMECGNTGAGSGFGPPCLAQERQKNSYTTI